MAWRLGSLFWTCVLACVGAASSEEAERCPEPAPAPLECGRSPHLSQLPAIGLHVLTANSVCDGNIGSMTMTVFVDGSVASDVGDRTPQVELPCDDSQTSQDEVSSLRAAVQEIVERERPALLARLHNSGALTDVAMQEVTERRPTVTELGRWAFFTPGGTSLGPSSGGTRRHGTLISVDRPVELTRALAEVRFLLFKNAVFQLFSGCCATELGLFLIVRNGIPGRGWYLHVAGHSGPHNDGSIVRFIVLSSGSIDEL